MSLTKYAECHCSRLLFILLYSHVGFAELQLSLLQHRVDAEALKPVVLAESV